MMLSFLFTVPLGLKVSDFGSAVLIQWDLVADAVGYHITLQQQKSDGSSLVKSESYDRSANQNYLFLPGNTCFVLHVFNIYLSYLYILFI